MEDNGFILFESGAILLHIGARSDVLLPSDPDARARATQWMIAALNSVESALANLFLIEVVFPHEEWARLRRQGAHDFALRRLKGLSNALGEKPYLDGDRFTVGDLMMASVLRIPGYGDLVTSDPSLGPYLRRCTERPAFKKALAAQMGDFKAAA